MGNRNDTKIYQILSYIGFLWIVGLLTSKKDDTALKTHVGQGMIIFFIEIIVLILNNFVIANVFTTNVGPAEFYYTSISPLGTLIMAILYITPIILSIYGIYKVVKEKDPKIPIICNLAKYK